MAKKGSYRLTKPRTNDSASPRSSTSTRSPVVGEYDVQIQTSYDDLKKPESRQQLRQQLSQQFPEATRKASQESINGSTMPFGNRFSRRVSNLDVGNIPSAKSSSSTVDSTQPPKRMSGLPEKENTVIDLEQAIYLLQELKKTATPQELVALHKALLPTREVEPVASPTFAKLDERTAFTPAPIRRSRSNLPPGLATRSGFGEDLLRKPEDALARSVRPKSEKRGTWLGHAPSGSLSSIAALDLADDAANPLSTRAATPQESAYAHMGAYRPGTLRITNGAASPEPSIRSALAAGPAAAGDTARDFGYLSSPESRPPLPTRASIDVVRSRPSEESFRIRDKILNSEKGLQQRQQRAKRMSGLSLTASKESLRAGTPLEIPPKTSRQSFDRDSVSSMSDVPTPRFQQRWSHRASQISQEYVSDCEITGSPYEDNSNALLNFATRLSTVYDSDADETDTERGTPEAALKRLTQTAPPISEVDENARSSSERQDEDENETQSKQVSLQTTRSARPHQPQKLDSGYGSDTSFRSLRVKTLQDATRARKKEAAQKALKHVEEREETPSPADGQSLYTFEDVLKSPTLLSGSPTASKVSFTTQESVGGKKQFSLLHLRSIKRASLPVMVQSVQSSDTIPTVASEQTAPEAKKTQNLSKLQQKKLQKPMPPSVKKQRKAEVKKLKEGGKKADGDTRPDARRVASEPPMVRLDLSDMTIGFMKSQEDLTPVPAEPSGDDDAKPQVAAVAPITTVEPSSLTERDTADSPRRSDSRGRQRSNTVRHDSTMDGTTTEAGRSWSIIRRRNKSQSRSRSQTPKRSSLDVLKSRRDSEIGRASSPGEDIIPAYTDFTSVARTLGSGSYDISTNQIKRQTAPVPGAVQHQIQSPWMISTGLIKSKSMKGMNEEAASELARAKSRDRAGHDLTAAYDRPRVAMPKRKQKRSSSRSSEHSVSVEDRFPDWQSKTAGDQSPQGPETPTRQFSMYAESIPPLPELPADVEFKVSKADVMVAKKLKESARSTPTTSARNSEEHLHLQKAESAKKPVKSRKEPEPKQVNEKTLNLLHPVERATVKADDITVEAREVNGSSSSSDVSTVAVMGETPVEEAPVEDMPQSPAHEAQHPGWVGWEEQAKRWRQHRESIGAALGKDIEEQSVVTADSPPMSRQGSVAVRDDRSTLPSISVQRYITPLGSDNAARANVGYRPSEAASQRADAYRNLCLDDKENRPAKPDIPRTDTAFSTSTTVTTSSFVTVKTWNPTDPRPAKEDVPRTDSAFSAKSYHTAVTTVSRAKSPGGHVHTPSGNFIPYSQSQAAIAERSRQNALAKLNGMANGSTQSLGERKPRKPKSSPESLVDRYSGGLDYGWERGAGFSGSAGTRNSASEAKRKSVQMSNEFGLDLSDVPVFLQRNMV